MASKNNSDMTMKIILVVALIASFVGGYVVARAKYKPQIHDLTQMVAEKDTAMQKLKVNANKVVMKEGKVWVVENGMLKVMENDLMLSNGTKVMTDGKVVTTEGKESVMQEGDSMDMNGMIMPTAGADKTNY